MTDAGNSFTLSAAGIEVAIDLAVGHISKFEVTQNGRILSPFHRAPWVGEVLADGMPAHLKHLSIDFFCAPFGMSDVEAAPAHGWSANAPWELQNVESLPDGMCASFTLSRKILSATLTKTLTVRDHHPFLYQSHRFDGGKGRLPVAYHAMVDLPNGGVLSVSPKILAETMSEPLEDDAAKGRSILAYPASSRNLTQFPRADGGFSNLLHYPLDQQHVDLVMLHEQPSNPFGWAVAARPFERDMALVLKSPCTLPSTVLWYSNGGRFYEPWSGRHRGVLGLEEATTFFGYGHQASITENALSRSGIPTSVVVGDGAEIRSIIGACDLVGSGVIHSVEPGRNSLSIVASGGLERRFAFDDLFLS
jgi:hypothetical protein